jgi:hypothetical protein
MANNFTEKANFIWSAAELIRDDFKRGKYQDVILPLTVCVELIVCLNPQKIKYEANTPNIKISLKIRIKSCAGPRVMLFMTRRNTTLSAYSADAIAGHNQQEFAALLPGS